MAAPAGATHLAKPTVQHGQVPGALSDWQTLLCVCDMGAAINTGGDTVVVIRSTRSDSDDRPAWTPPGPNYTSTYREGVAVAGPVRLIVEVDFEYHG